MGFKVLGPPILVRERAFEQVREAIISGRLAPGTRLIERELCEAMGISRASVREVIRRLEAERLVESAPRRGPMVVTLTRKQADEIYEIRATLESLLVRHFTKMAPTKKYERCMRSLMKSNARPKWELRRKPLRSCFDSMTT